MASNSTSTEFDSLRFPSWCLSRILDKIIGIEEAVALRRKTNGMQYYLIDVFRGIKILHSGSKAEGLLFKSSDVDLMLVDTHVLVTDVIHSTNDNQKTVLMMRRDRCNPGFVILQLKRRSYRKNIVESLVVYEDSLVVSSILFRDAHTLTRFGLEGHGPCNTFFHHCDVDIAHCFECKTWPSEAFEFIHRLRPYGWPQKTLLHKIIRRGCHVVPIGDKDHDLSYIQWRLSFSAAEKDLIHSFNHTQLKVYAALKIFLKQVINQIKPVEDLLCSYFLKTVLFYSIESTPASFWKEDLLILCFWFCVNKLYKYIEDGYLPNYFVPQNNMFRSKVTGANQQNLLRVFNQLKRIGWPCLYLCKDFSSLQTFVRFPETVVGNAFILSNSLRMEAEFDVIMIYFVQTFFFGNTQMMKDYLSRASTLVRYARSQREKDLSVLLLNSTFCAAGQFIFCNRLSFNNKDRYKMFKKCERFLLASCETDICAGYLNLATFYYKIGQYNKCIQNCWYLITQWKPFVLYWSNVAGGIYNVNAYQQCVCGRELPVLEKARSWGADIIIYPGYKTFYPNDLHYDIEANLPFEIHVPPLPYTYFLLVLCHHKLRNVDESLAALRHLQRLIPNEQQGSRHYPIVLNFLAICLYKTGDIPGATEACSLSQRLKPNRNGASKLLDKILREHS